MTVNHAEAYKNHAIQLLTHAEPEVKKGNSKKFANAKGTPSNKASNVRA